MELQGIEPGTSIVRVPFYLHAASRPVLCYIVLERHAVNGIKLPGMTVAECHHDLKGEKEMCLSRRQDHILLQMTMQQCETYRPKAKALELQGIEPCTSRMQSERSTI